MNKILVLGASGAMGRHAVPLLVLLSTLGAPVMNAETVGENVTEARPVLARPSLRGGLSFGGAEIFIKAFAPGWDSIPVKVDVTHPADGPRPVEIRGAKTYFKGTTEWQLQPDATIRGRIEMECVAPVVVQCVAVAVDIPSPPPFGLGDASSAEFDLPLADGRTARLSFPQPVRYHSQDSRQWGGNWTVRFAGNGGHLGHGGTRSFETGDRLVWEMTLATPDGLELADTKPIDIVANDDWVRLDYRKDIVAGSALDLSDQGLQDAPAGKHGWLKSVGGHFEFENLPGVEQRFYGVNLCFTANYPDHDVADRLVDRFVRLGYNTIRVHHHDGAWAKAYARRELPAGGGSGAEPPVVVTNDIDKLDYLLAKCFERGIYVTTDLYVSRSVNWRDIGVDRDGEMNKHLYKTYVGIHDGAFADWCHWARAFLEHVNPYTGHAYKDEPGLPLISLINEGKLAMAWGGGGKAQDPVVREAWKQFGGDGDTPPGSGASSIDSPHHRFDAWVNRRVWERCTAFVRSLGCRALLTNDNNGRWHGEGEGNTPLYDYVDNHFYVDHPQFLDQQWRLPSKCGNANPIPADLPAILHRGYAKGASKPYAITEWNFSGPGRYRGMGGILTGAMAAEQEWDGLWRFAYSHDRKNLPDGKGFPGYFDCVTDPLIAASDRASVCLFLRGDATKEQSDERRVTSDERQEADGPALRLDKERGSMTLVTPRTCGGFAESGRIEAGPLSFEIGGGSGAQPPVVVPTTLWASSLDGKPIATSSRILLTHLTDVQGDGVRYADEDRKILLKWGKEPLIKAGASDVSLRLDGGSGAEPPSVWSLDTAGNRIAEVPAEVRDGALRFRVSTDGPEGGRIYYEIVRSAAEDSSLFAKRGTTERLSLSYATVQAGAEKPFSVLHVSDTHLTLAYDDEGDKKTTLRDARTKTFGGLQMEALRDTLAWGQTNADFVVHTGDLIDFQSRANFDAVREMFAGSPPVFGCLGNHEYNPDLWLNDPKENGTEAWKDRSRDTLRQVYPFDGSFHSRVVNGVNFVALDNVFGTVTETQVERFKAEAAKGLPIILCVHVPFFTDGLWAATRKFWAKPGTRLADVDVSAMKGERLAQSRDPVTRDFIAYLKTEPLLKAILAGHVHFSAEERFSPTAVQYTSGGNFLFCAREVLVF